MEKWIAYYGVMGAVLNDNGAEFTGEEIKEVKDILRKMKPSNSRGDSEVTGRILKTLSRYMAVALTHLANKIFSTGKFPDAGKLKTTFRAIDP